MAFTLFSRNPFGKIKSVEIIEAEREQLQKDYVEFQKVEKSDELKQIPYEKPDGSRRFSCLFNSIDARRTRPAGVKNELLSHT